MHKIDAAETRMLRWMCGKTRKNKIRNELFWEQLGVASIGDKIRETRLWWFGHVQCRTATAPVRKSLAVKVDDPPRGRGRPKRMCMKLVKIDLKKCNLSKDLAQDRLEWRNRIRVADPIIVETRLWWWWIIMKSLNLFYQIEWKSFDIKYWKWQ